MSERRDSERVPERLYISPAVPEAAELGLDLFAYFLDQAKKVEVWYFDAEACSCCITAYIRLDVGVK